MRTMGWPYPRFELKVGWTAGTAFTTWLVGIRSSGTWQRFVDSVLASSAVDLLAGCTSMHDLMVVTRPLPEPPYDVVAVRSPSSMHPVPAGHVVIEHLAVTGRNDRITRPAVKAVALFWRFMIEKYGVSPTAGTNGTRE